MCGRSYKTVTDAELAARYLSKRKIQIPLLATVPKSGPNYNMCPTQKALVFNVQDGQLGFHEMRWGLVPAWAKSVKDAAKYSLINAKGEEIANKRTYSAAYKARRCIVPVSGFFEWKREGKTKRPFAIHLKDDAIMSLAGVWEHWVDNSTGEIIDSYALITTSANSFMAKIHDRMPVILAREDEDKWLDPSVTDPQQLDLFLKPCPSEWLEADEVSTLVNSPQNNSAQVLVPAK